MNEAYACKYDPLSTLLGYVDEVKEDTIQPFSLGINHANIQQEIKVKQSINLSKALFNRATDA